ncbi:MAG: M23 family metallopeptidase [Pyrinomonadaceae bacterium]
MAHHYVRPPFRFGGKITHDYTQSHRARDVAPRNDDDGDVFAIEGGTVTEERMDMEAGGEVANVVIIRSTGGYLTVYGHVFSEVFLGQTVKLGQRIGRVDESGQSTGRHVHLVRLSAWGGDKDTLNDVLARQDGAQYFTLSLKPWPAGELPTFQK